MVDESWKPAGIVTEGWLGARLKSTALTTMKAWWDTRLPEIRVLPVTVKVNDPLVKVPVRTVSMERTGSLGESETDCELRLTPGPDGTTVAVKLTIPEKPFTLGRMMLDEF